jgi:RYK receptor-like tyrosine kinase
MNISSIGEIPEDVQTFGIGLPCSGVRKAEVEVVISIEVILNRATNNVTNLMFKRNKICLQSEIKEATTIKSILKENFEKSPKAIAILVIGVVFALALIKLLLSIAFCSKAQSKRTLSQPVRTSSFQRLTTHSSLLLPTIYPNTLPRSKSSDPEELYRKISEITIQKCRVRLSGLLLEGTFGRLYRGTYKDNQEILVKTVNPHASKMQVSMLLQEGMSLYGASHINILSVFGISVEDHTAPILLYSGDNNMRNLKQFLHEPVARALTTIQIVKMSLQLTSAIGHLHSNGVLHKDIAARNCV